MDTRKMVLYFALAIVIFLLWQAWQQDYGQRAAPEAATPPTEMQAAAKSTAVSSSNLPPLSALSDTRQQTTAVGANVTTTPQEQLIEVQTDVLNVKIDKRGGNIIGLNLLKYPVSYQTKNIPVALLTDDPQNYYVAESGLTGEKGPDTKSGQALYQSTQSHYSLATGKNTLVVPLT